MFEESASDKAIKYGAIAIAAIGVAWAISYAIRDGRKKADLAAMSVAVDALDKSLQPLQRVADSANAGMAAHVERIQAKQQEARERAAEIREAAKPKAYRWQDADGQWHLSDAPPTDTTAEIIPLQPLKKR